MVILQHALAQVGEDSHTSCYASLVILQDQQDFGAIHETCPRGWFILHNGAEMYSVRVVGTKLATFSFLVQPYGAKNNDACTC